jgi:hypothetical protein
MNIIFLWYIFYCSNCYNFLWITLVRKVIPFYMMLCIMISFYEILLNSSTPHFYTNYYECYVNVSIDFIKQIKR